MKTLLAALLFCHVVVAICSFAPFEDITAVKLEELKREWKNAEDSNSKLTTELAKLFDEGKESSISEGPKDEKQELDAVQKVVDALGKKIIPAVLKATEQRDEESEEYAKELIKELHEGSKKDAKQALGKAVAELHEKCFKIQIKFLIMAKESGLLDILQQAMGPEDNLDLAEITKQALEAGDESDVFDALEKINEMIEMAKGGKVVSPAMKAFVVVNKILARASCGNPVKGLIEVIGKRIKEEDSGHEPFPDLQDKILPFLGLTNGTMKQPCKKRENLIGKNDSPDSLKKKIMTLVLQEKKAKLCKDVPVVLRQLNVIMDAIYLTGKVHTLMKVDGKQRHALIEQIKRLVEHGQYEYAFKLVGNVALEYLKKGLLIGMTVYKKLDKQKPPKPGKPSGPKDLSSLDTLLRGLENA